MSGHAFDHNAFDSVAFDTDASVGLFGGAPRQFFSYSGERLAWSERPLVPKSSPPTIPPIVVGRIAIGRTSGPAVFASGRVTVRGAVGVKCTGYPAVAVVANYIPPRVVGVFKASRQDAPLMRAIGDVIYWDDPSLIEEISRA